MKKQLILSLMLLLGSMLTLNVYASITPDTLSATLKPGESITEHKTVFLPGTIPKGDIVFAFDLTGSMSGEINVMKTEASNIMTTLDTLVSDAQYGVMSFMDYPHAYSSYGYSATYGDPFSGDYAYNLDLAITGDRPLVTSTINSLTLGWGADEPQDYTRIMYESYSDAAVGWRTGAKRILIILGDALPHDDDLNIGVPGKSGIRSTGGDPGRNEVMDFGGDDLDLQTVLSEMSTNDVTLLFLLGASPYPDAMDYWSYWTGLTGGNAYSVADVSQIPTAIQTLISEEAAHVDVLTLKAETGYELWLTDVAPPQYTGIDIPSEGVTREFDIEITVPAGTLPGMYIFHIIADADGASYGEQEVTIIVPITPVIPEVPFGTIMTLASMLMVLVGFVGFKRFRAKT